jgi:hypothetical protein
MNGETATDTDRIFGQRWAAAWARARAILSATRSLSTQQPGLQDAAVETNKPIGQNTDPAPEGDRRTVKDLTYLLSPPSDREAVLRIVDMAAENSLSPIEQWIAMVVEYFLELVEAGEEGRSILDEMASEALGQPVTVRGAQGVLIVEAGREHPGLTIRTEQVLDATGRTIEWGFSDPETRERLGRALMHFTNADQVTCIASVDPKEPRSPGDGGAGGRPDLLEFVARDMGGAVYEKICRRPPPATGSRSAEKEKEAEEL